MLCGRSELVDVLASGPGALAGSQCSWVRSGVVLAFDELECDPQRQPDGERDHEDSERDVQQDPVHCHRRPGSVVCGHRLTSMTYCRPPTCTRPHVKLTVLLEPRTRRAVRRR